MSAEEIKMSIVDKVEVLQAVAEQTMSVAEAALALGLTELEVRHWSEVYAMTSELAARNERRRAKQTARVLRRAAVGLATLAAVVAGVRWVQPALAQMVCAPSLPMPLKTFCANAPALADDVNGNFSTVVSWLATKTGALGTPDLATRDISARDVTLSGAASLATGTLGFGSTNRQMLNLYSTAYGVGVQNSTQYSRSVTNFGWYKGGSHATTAFDPGPGGTLLMKLDGVGNLTTTGSVTAQGGLGTSSCAWNESGYDVGANNTMHTVSCPAGQYVAGWRCFASGYLDGSCAIYCCRP
jgi:hypothetical protein